MLLVLLDKESFQMLVLIALQERIKEKPLLHNADIRVVTIKRIIQA